jgi:glyoxylase-like metal-dependent hydrolase (beta-lactamase superfamily II)
MLRWQVGDAAVTRVMDDEFELLVPQDERTAAAVLADASWLAPWSITDEGTLRLGSSATLIESRGTHIVVDPWLAFEPSDAGRLLVALERSGCAADDVDVVVNSHIDGVGLNGSFPNARTLVMASELGALAAGRRDGCERFQTLADSGLVDHPEDGHVITDEVRLRHVPGHVDGHLVVEVASRGESAVVIGHLFLHPAQIGAPEATLLDDDPERLITERKALLAEWAANGTLVVGPLFAAPGAGRIVANGDGWRLDLAD